MAPKVLLLVGLWDTVGSRVLQQLEVLRLLDAVGVLLPIAQLQRSCPVLLASKFFLATTTYYWYGVSMHGRLAC